MSEGAALAKVTHLVFVELRTVLCLVKVIRLGLLFCDFIVGLKLFDTVSVVAVPAELAVAWSLLPVLAQLTLQAFPIDSLQLAWSINLSEGPSLCRWDEF